jgi:hypothetical protein
LIALLMCGAALLCVWAPRLHGWVIPVAGLGAGLGLIGLVLLPLERRAPSFLSLAGAALPTLVLVTALFFPQLLGSAFLASRTKEGVENTGIYVLPLKGAPNNKVSADPDWADAGKVSLQQGQVNVQVLSASIRRMGETKTASGGTIASGERCIVRLRIEEAVPGRGLSAARSAARSPHQLEIRPRLTLSAGEVRELLGELKLPPLETQEKGPAFPINFEDHLFAFEAPERPEYLQLEIPTASWGGKGSFRFTIPASMIQDERGTRGYSRNTASRSKSK